MRKLLFPLLVLAALLLLALLMLAVPARADEPSNPQAAETNWASLEQLPTETLLAVEEIDGKRHRGQLHGVAPDALSIRQRKNVVGFPRERVARVWLLGARKIAQYAVLGALVGALTGGAWTAAQRGRGPVCPWDAEGYTCVFYSVSVLAAVGAGAGAGLGAGVRKQTLIYRSPPEIAAPHFTSRRERAPVVPTAAMGAEREW